MEVKFVKFLKTTNQLFLSINGEMACFAINYSHGVPYVTPEMGSREAVEEGIEYLMSKIGPSIVDKAKEGTKFTPLGIGMFTRLLGLGGWMNRSRWSAVVDFDVNAPRAYRGPSPSVSYCHFVYKGTVIENDIHFVTVTTSKYFLLLADNGTVHARVGVEVPPGAEINNYVSVAKTYLRHIRDGRKGLCDMVSAETANLTVDMSTGSVEFLSGGNWAPYLDMSTEAIITAREICDYFELTVPQGLLDKSVSDAATVDKKEVSIANLFELGDTVHDFLPGECIRCEEAIKFGDYYYLIHGMELSAGEQDGILVRVETVRYGSSKNGIIYSNGSPVGILFDHYAITRSVDPMISVTDFTGMSEKEFTRYLRKQCR